MDRAATRKLDTAGKVLCSTITSSILPALSVPEQQTDWGFLLVSLAGDLDVHGFHWKIT